MASRFKDFISFADSGWFGQHSYMSARIALRLLIVLGAYLILVLLEGYLPTLTLPMYFVSLFGLCLFFVFPFGGYFLVLRRAPILQSVGRAGRIFALTGICLLLTLLSFMMATMMVFILYPRH